MPNNSSDNNTQPQTTDTNMLISILANSEKLKPRNELHHYEDEAHNDDEKIESCMDDDENHDAQPHDEIKQEQYEQQETQQAPSYQEYPKQYQEVHAYPPPPDANLGNQIKLTTATDVDEYDSATPERKKLLKLNMIRKLTELVSKGVKLSQNYNMDSDYKTMKYECELHNSIREKHNTVLFLQDSCIASIGALEKVNKKFNYFGLELDGWSNNVSGKSDQLYDAFGDMYEKWSGPGKSIPPEITLIGILGFSAAKTHWVNTSADNVPSIEDKRRDDPQYLEKIRQQALGNTVIDHDKKQNTVFTEKLSKQYDDAIAQALDYKKLREQEEEYNKMKSQQIQQANLQPTMKLPPSILQRQQNIMMQHITPSSMTNEQFTNFRTANFVEQQEKFEKELEKRGLRDDVSQESIVQINPDLDDILKDAESVSNSGRRKKPVNRKKQKSNTIKLGI